MSSLVRNVKTKFLDYDLDRLRSTKDALRRAVFQRVRSELLALPANQRPYGAETDEIASAYARFLILRRTANREEYLERVVHKPSAALTDEDTQSAEKVWKYNSAWARHADIPVDSIRVAPMFIGGTPVGDFEPRGTRVMRLLPNGEMLSPDTVGRHGVYQVLIDLTVPSIDASEEVDVTLGTMLINDGARGEWSPIANEFIGVPKGKFCYTPSP